jgi:hypothetical protein
MYRSTEEKLMASPEQRARSNIIQLSSRQAVQATMRIAPAVSDWPVNLQISWDLAH